MCLRDAELLAHTGSAYDAESFVMAALMKHPDNAQLLYQRAQSFVGWESMVRLLIIASVRFKFA